MNKKARIKTPTKRKRRPGKRGGVEVFDHVPVEKAIYTWRRGKGVKTGH